MKNLAYIFLGLAALKFLSASSSSSISSPGAVVQQIRDQNAAFWASVGAPYSVNSGGMVVAPPDYSPGVSAIAYDPNLIEGT